MIGKSKEPFFEGQEVATRLDAQVIFSGENPHDFITCSSMGNRFRNWVLVTEVEKK